MVNYEIDAVDAMYDILERNPGTEFRFTYWKPDHRLEIRLFNWENRITVSKFVDKNEYKFVPKILLEMEKEYQKFIAKKE